MAAWVLVFETGMSYREVFHEMTPDEIGEACAAYNSYAKRIDAQNKRRR